MIALRILPGDRLVVPDEDLDLLEADDSPLAGALLAALYEQHRGELAFAKATDAARPRRWRDRWLRVARERFYRAGQRTMEVSALFAKAHPGLTLVR